MATPQVIRRAIDNLTDRNSLVNELLVNTLEWPVTEDAQEEALDGVVWELRTPRGGDAAWGICLLQLAPNDDWRTRLCQVLRGLVADHRRHPHLTQWREDFLFLCTTPDCHRFTFAHVRGDRLATFGWEKKDRCLRTVCEFHLPALSWPKDGGADAAAWRKAWARAFDKEPLTRDFLRRFGAALAAVKKDLQTYQGLGAAEAHRQAQQLLERLVVLSFMQRRDLGDLFAPAPLKVRSETVAFVFQELLDAFPFTAREDAPLDQDAAVGPEMLGKVFESIVLPAEPADRDAAAPHRRKATGSYYTPRPVVHFICREALRQCLGRQLPGGDWGRRLKELMEMDAAGGLPAAQVERLRELLTPEEGSLLRDRLRRLRCCDPAVGSGAFPVGLLHELVNLRRVAETAADGYVDPVRTHGNAWLGRLKRQIVRDCLFGVDLQQQAVEICRLRLRLSLLADGDPDPGIFTADLERNFRRGDSLLDPVFPELEGGFDLVVGNPPFVTARNPEQRERYRQRWPRVSSGHFQLLGPFLELSMGLLAPDGELGFIVSNAFARREFGQGLVENLLPTVGLHKVVDCSGLLFPGHGTPTCLLFARLEPPEDSQPVRVLAILPGGGDLRTPAEESPLWDAISRHHDEPGFEDRRVAVHDWERQRFLHWPMSFDFQADELRRRLESRGTRTLGELIAGTVGRVCFTGADDIFFVEEHLLRRLGLRKAGIARFAEGDRFRNWSHTETHCLCPYTQQGELIPAREAGAIRRYLKPWESFLRRRLSYGETQDERGRSWWEYSLVFSERLAGGRAVSLCEIATHLHAEVVRKPFIANRANPIFVLAGTPTEQDYDLVAGLLNSSAALFWLKQVCYNKGAGEDEERDRFEYAGGKVEKLPVSAEIGDALLGRGLGVIARRLRELSAACRRRGTELAGLTLRKLFEKEGEAYQQWRSELVGYSPPPPVAGKPFATAHELRANFRAVVGRREQLRRELIARQEEMDWLVYAAFGLVDDPGTPPADADLALGREERPFCLWVAADGVLDRAAALIPRAWSAARQALWRKRLEILHTNEMVRRIEQPVYKRRWDEQWKCGSAWQCGPPAYDAEFLEAFAWWLAEKAEWWLEHRRKNNAASLAEWTAALWGDPRVRAAWAVAAATVLRVVDFATFFREIVKGQSVPAGLPFGTSWAEVEAGRSVPRSAKALRGKLNVPRERFWVTADGRYRPARPAAELRRRSGPSRNPGS
jgi:hypothetical protein